MRLSCVPAKPGVTDTARHVWRTAELSMQEKSHSSPPTSFLLICPAPVPAAWTDHLTAPLGASQTGPGYGPCAPGGWLDSPCTTPAPEIVRGCYLCSDNHRTFDAILMFGILPHLSSSRSVKELHTAVTQREASVERVCRSSQQLSCGGL